MRNMMKENRNCTQWFFGSVLYSILLGEKLLTVTFCSFAR
jgi:hypothetical protein